jgi:membrane fusion protein (multidrug efflux system)
MLIAVLLSAVAAARSADVPVVVAVVQEASVVEEVPIVGTVTSPRVARLSPQVAGLVSEVLVDAGARVEAGATLLRLDQALATLDVEAAEAAALQADEELADARRRLRDAERLVTSRGIAETEVEARRSEVRADRANVNLREAELRRQQERLRRHVIEAPFAGVISRKLAETGEWVVPGDQVLELVADRPLRIDFQIPQRYFPRVDERSRVRVRFDAAPDRPLEAAVGEVVPVSDPAARTFLVRVLTDDYELALTPGMSAGGHLLLPTRGKAAVVSRDALLRHPDGRVTVWVIDAAGDADTSTVTERLVETGLTFEGQVVIERGLDVGARVVVEGNEALQQGQQVAIRGTR